MEPVHPHVCFQRCRSADIGEHITEDLLFLYSVLPYLFSVVNNIYFRVCNCDIDCIGVALSKLGAWQRILGLDLPICYIQPVSKVIILAILVLVYMYL